MSSTLIFEPGFGDSRRRSHWWRDADGAYATTVHDSTETLRMVWDLTDYLAASETLSSAAYSNEGATATAVSATTPQVIFTITGIGASKVTATLSTGRKIIRRFRIYQETSAPLVGADYGNR